MISVALPIGPRPHHREYLGEMLESIRSQTRLPEYVILIFDGWVPSDFDVTTWELQLSPVQLQTFISPWNVGVSDAMNFGVAVSRTELVLMACADDRLLPTCIERCLDAWERIHDPLGYYYLGVRYSDGREQNVPCGAAMVTKTLWRYTGGFFPQCSVGAADHIFIHALLCAQARGVSRTRLLPVSPEPVYWYRCGEGETSRNNWPAIEAVKERLSMWTPPGECE